MLWLNEGAVAVDNCRSLAEIMSEDVLHLSQAPLVLLSAGVPTCSGLRGHNFFSLTIPSGKPIY